MRNIEIWRHELFVTIRAISDSVGMRRLWLGLEPGAISSFAEEVAHVFHDFDIDGLIKLGPEGARLNLKQFSALCEFRDQLRMYVNGVPTRPLTLVDPITVLDDPKWEEVVRAARKFVSLLDGAPTASATG
jgi:hypothetical protein